MIRLSEGHPRGFCSNFFCLYGALLCAEATGAAVIAGKHDLFSLYTDQSTIYDSWHSLITSPLAECVETLAIDRPVDMGRFLFAPKDFSEFISASSKFTRLIRFDARLLDASVKLANSINTCYGHYFAVHRRCTDHTMHEDLRSAEVFFLLIDQVLPDYDYFFLASDSQHEIELFEQRYGPKMRTINCERSTSNIPVHFSVTDTNCHDALPTKYQRAVEVLADIYLIAQASFCISTNSGIPAMARLINPALEIIDITRGAK